MSFRHYLPYHRRVRDAHSSFVDVVENVTQPYYSWRLGRIIPGIAYVQHVGRGRPGQEYDPDNRIPAHRRPRTFRSRRRLDLQPGRLRRVVRRVLNANFLIRSLALRRSAALSHRRRRP